MHFCESGDFHITVSLKRNSSAVCVAVQRVSPLWIYDPQGAFAYKKMGSSSAEAFNACNFSMIFFTRVRVVF